MPARGGGRSSATILPSETPCVRRRLVLSAVDWDADLPVHTERVAPRQKERAAEPER